MPTVSERQRGLRLRRRQFLFGLGGLLLPLGVGRDASAQTPVPRIGWLKAESASHAHAELASFTTALQALGHPGKSFDVVARYADGNVSALRGFADELVRSDVAVIVATSQPAVDAAFAATKTVPIVGRMTVNPMGNGMAKTLGHPEGNVTGLFSLFEELVERRLTLLREAVPELHKVGVLLTVDYADSAYWLSKADEAIKKQGLERYVMNVHTEADLDSAFADAAENGVNGFITFRSPIIVASYDRIVELANSYLYRLPGIFDARSFADSGGFMSFGPSMEAELRTLAGLVDRILKGEKPGELAIEHPSAFELVINLQTAQVIGLDVPKAVRATADYLITD